MNSTDIHIGLADSERDLEQILALQQLNLKFSRDGFVTVNHTINILRTFHKMMPSVVAKHQAKVVGYALSMPRETNLLVPVLQPMFERLDSLPILRNQRWYAMGQVCVDHAWRGVGVFDRLYAMHRECFADQFDWLVTEIAQRNPRSLNAHARIGFVEIDHYADQTDEWSVVGLRLNDTN